MQAKIEHAMRQALEARQKADACMDTRVREQWLHVAAMWDQFVRACEEIKQVQESSLLSKMG